MPGRMEMDDSSAVDIGKRYDIYAIEGSSRVVVYRGAYFRGVKYLEKTRTDYGSEFLEIEQANGELVFVRRHFVVKFCDAGAKLEPEVIA